MRRRAWRRFFGLSWSDRLVVANALVLLPLIHNLLRVLSFARVHSLLSSLLPAASGGTSAPITVDRVTAITRLVQRANEEGACRVKCLPHSLALWWLLRRHGADAVLRVGVRKANAELDAHAWVEYNGVALNDDAAVHDRFAAFDRAIAQ